MITKSGTQNIFRWSHRKCHSFLREILLPDDYQIWDLEYFWMVSPKVSPFFEGNSASWWSRNLWLRIFLDGLTESVTLFWGKFWFQMITKSGTWNIFGWSHQKCHSFLREILLPDDYEIWDLKYFWMVSSKVSLFFEGNSASRLLRNLGLRIFLDGLTESVTLFWGKFYFIYFSKVWWLQNLELH